MLEFANNSYWEDLKHEDSWLKSIIHEGEYWNDEKEKKEYLLRYIWLDLIFSRFDFDWKITRLLNFMKLSFTTYGYSYLYSIFEVYVFSSIFCILKIKIEFKTFDDSDDSDNRDDTRTVKTVTTMTKVTTVMTMTTMTTVTQWTVTTMTTVTQWTVTQVTKASKKRSIYKKWPVSSFCYRLYSLSTNKNV